MNTSFWKSGHIPTLFAAFLYFDLSFMVWYLLGPLAVQIASDLQLTTQQRGLMVATPILSGAILRFIMGVLVDRLSPKTAGLIGQVIVITALFCAWRLGIHSYEQALLLWGFPRCGRRLLCCLPAAGFTVVPGPTSGQGHGHCRCRKLRHRVCRPLGSGAGRRLWLEQRLWFRPDTAGS